MLKPVFLFASGAGAPSTHPWMQRWAGLLGKFGEIETFDYAYLLEGRKRPDPLPRLIATHRAALAQCRIKHSGPIVLVGKSMGSRIGCHVALEENVAALVCLGYPLCGAGDRTKLRDQVLLQLRTPVLFIQGTRDALCPLDLLANVRAQMQAPHQLEVIEGGDHSLAVTQRQLKASGETQAEVEGRILQVITAFVAKVCGRSN